MTFYYILWAVPFFFSLLYIYDSKRKPMLSVPIVLIAVVSFFVACRVDVGADWYNYVSLYKTGKTLSGEFERFEPLFMLSIKVLNFLRVSYQGFFFILSFLSMSSLMIIAKKFGIKNYYFVFLIYVSSIFCSYQLNTIRSGLMCVCVWIAFLMKSKGDLNKSILWCLIGVGFHYLGLAFIPVLFIIDRPYKKEFVLVAIALSYIAMFVNVGGYIVNMFPMLNDFERVSTYFDVSDSPEYGISVGSLFNLSVFLYCFFKYQDHYRIDLRFRIVLNAMFIVILFSGFFNSYVTIVSRFGQVLNLSLIFVWPMLFEKIPKREFRIALIIPVAVYLMLYYNRAFKVNEVLGYSLIVPFKFELASFFVL